jgi:hypothetical protein
MAYFDPRPSGSMTAGVSAFVHDVSTLASGLSMNAAAMSREHWEKIKVPWPDSRKRPQPPVSNASGKK